MTKYARIIGTGSYLPEKVVTNADLEKIVDTSNEWIIERTGIKERHQIAGDQRTSDMALIAAERAIEASGIDKNEIGLIICACATSEFLFPSAACIVQKQLGIKDSVVFDLNAACTGFIYGLGMAQQFIANGTVKYALVVASEALSRVTDWSDRTTCVLFADGAGAAVLRADNEPGVYSTHLHADGSYQDLLYGRSGLFADDEVTVKMRGNEVFKVAVTKLGDVLEEALAYNNLTVDDLDWFVPHQANYRIITATAKRIKMPREKVVFTVAEHGNTSAASVPLALDTAIRDGRIKSGHKVLIEAFGAGFTWGSALLRL